MVRQNMVWLASWPRSGNTFLRTILWYCFGLKSGSVYADEFSGNNKLQQYVGHVEDKKSLFVPGNIPLIKTHEAPADDGPAIYIVRHGMDATLSLCQYYHQTPPEFVIEGSHRFGTWASHLHAWKPWERPDTLLLRYEDLTDNLPEVLKRVSLFLDVKILNEVIPPRDAIADVDGRVVKKASLPKPVLSASLTRRFIELNGEMLERLGYKP